MSIRSGGRLAAILMLAALPACAADQPQAAAPTSPPARMAQHMEHGPMGPMHHHGRHGGMMGPERIEGRLAFLKTELKITDAQAPQWNAFADFLRTEAKAMGERHAQFRAQHEARQQAQQQGGKPGEVRAARPLTERLDAGEKMMQARLDGMRRFRAAVEPLYKVLSPEQQKTADQLLAQHGHRHA